MATIVITVLIGITCVAFGYLIGKKQMLEILAGHDPKKVTDKKGLARWVGTNLVLMGVLAFFSAALMAVFPQTRTVLLLVYALAAIPLLCVRIILGNRRYTRS